MPLLPPVNQNFTANAAGFMAAIDEMLDGLDELATSLDEVTAQAADLSGATAPATEALEANTEATDAAAGSMDALALSIGRVEGLLDAQIGAIDANTAAIDEMSAAYGENAGAADTASASAEGFASKGKLAFFAVAAGIGFAVESAAKFQAAMTRINTQADVSKSEIGGLTQGVLELASQVGYSPDSLSESLYHVESSFQSIGITAPKALALVKTAAEGAKVGNADLVDVTNALDATIASGIGGVKNYSQAMGVLNGIVGSGDMTMENLAQAMGSGIMAVAKSYGQNIYQVGAALATLGDNNIRGAKAATDLRMAWQALMAPLTTATPILNKLGLSYTQLGQTLSHQGMTAAIQQFVDHLNASKVPMDDWGQLVTEIFGKRAGVGIGVMIDQLSRLQGKLPDLEKNAKDFGNAWTNTQKTFSQQWHDALSGIEALGISFGTMLLPAVTKAAHALGIVFGWLEKHPAVGAIVGAIIAVTAAIGGISIAVGVLDTLLSPVNLIAIAIVALAVGIYELWEHCKTFRDAIEDLAHFFEAGWQSAIRVAGAVITWFTNGPLAFIRQQIAVFTAFWQQNHAEIERIARAAWTIISGTVKIAWDILYGIIKAGLAVLQSVWLSAWDIISTTVRVVWNVLATIIRDGVKIILDAISIFLDVLQGNWSGAWDKLKDLVSTALNEVVTVCKDILGGLVTILFDLGKNMVEGLINGVKSMFGSVGSVMSDLAHEAESAFKSVLSIFSPSQVMKQHGIAITQGLVEGIAAGTPQVTASMRHLAGAAGLSLTGAGGLAVGGAGGGAGGTVNFHVSVQSLTGTLDPQVIQQLYLLMQKATLQNNRRNANNGLSLR